MNRFGTFTTAGRTYAALLTTAIVLTMTGASAVAAGSEPEIAPEARRGQRVVKKRKPVDTGPPGFAVRVEALTELPVIVGGSLSFEIDGHLDRLDRTPLKPACLLRETDVR